MYVLITYDVQTTSRAGKTRLRKIAKICLDYGQRVQNSVFECKLSEQELLVLRSGIIKIMNSNEDSVRIYRLGKNYESKIEHLGAKQPYNFEEAYIV